MTMRYHFLMKRPISVTAGKDVVKGEFLCTVDSPVAWLSLSKVVWRFLKT